MIKTPQKAPWTQELGYFVEATAFAHQLHPVKTQQNIVDMAKWKPIHVFWAPPAPAGNYYD